MQLGEFTYMTSKQDITSKQVKTSNMEQLVKDRNNRSGSTRRHEDDSRSSFLVRGSTSTFGGVWHHKGLPTPQRPHPILR